VRATSEFQLLLTYSTSSRHGGQAKAGFDAPLAQPHRDEAGSQYVARRGRLVIVVLADPGVQLRLSLAQRRCYSFLQATRLPLQWFNSCIISGL
jgi:hypothetical protein